MLEKKERVDVLMSNVHVNKSIGKNFRKPAGE
jgi:hypothetical protein